MNKLNVLIIADEEDIRFLDTKRESDHWNIFWKVVDYNKLHQRVGELQDLVKGYHIDFLLYSRNDQVANRIKIGPITRKLRTGYSSFSGIDDRNRIKQMQTCFEDFMECGRKLNFKLDQRPQEKGLMRNSKGTFSLIFDTEQLGGVRFGLSRILNLLDRYNIKATFFVTNLMGWIYPNLIEAISSLAHEIGIHGRYHEYLNSYGPEDQEQLIKKMIKDFNMQIRGANFIGRMDKNTISLLAKNRMIQYLTCATICDYIPFGFRRFPANPVRFGQDDNYVWMIPVAVETYGRPWYVIRGMLDFAVSEVLKTNIKHITILLHPFRDGTLRHIATLEKLILYLLRKGLSPKLLRDKVNELPTDDSNRENCFFDRKRRLMIPSSTKDVLYIPVLLFKATSRLAKNRYLF